MTRRQNDVLDLGYSNQEHRTNAQLHASKFKYSAEPFSLYLVFDVVFNVGER